MPPITLERLTEHLELADALRLGRDALFEPQDLPGLYGRVVKAVDRVLAVIQGEGVLVGGWAVWQHGYMGRVTQDLVVVLPGARINEFLRVAAFSGFDVLSTKEGAWPKLEHGDTHIQVDLLPEGGRPGTMTRPAPTTIPPPSLMGGVAGNLRYITLHFFSGIEISRRPREGRGRHHRTTSCEPRASRIDPRALVKSPRGLFRHLRGVAEKIPRPERCLTPAV